VERFGWISRVIHEQADGYHVDHRGRLIGISWVDCLGVRYVITFGVIHEEVVDGVLVSKSRTFQPKRIGLWQVLHPGLVIC
jgi:hypothetical protein